MLIRILFAALFLSAIVACGNQQAKKNQEPVSAGAKNETKTESIPFTLLSPSSGSRVNWGDTLTFSYTSANSSIAVDSSTLTINGHRVAGYRGENTFTWVVPKDTKVGSMPATVAIWHDGGKVSRLNAVLKVFPPAPAYYDYEVVNTYPHDVEAYTQGLYYNDSDGFLYEGTGQNGKSTLRRVELKTGKVVKSVPLESQYFGEGIALLNGKIYQLTYQSRKGFVYDVNTFERIGEFTYPTEGWGLTTDGKYLIMSDGSSFIRYMDPETFKEVKHIEVYSHDGAMVWINELEYINGELWANLYTIDTVIAIAPETGRVTKVVDLRNLLPNSLRTADTDVLNGIAYNKNREGSLYVTGKNWPKLYEIKPIPRKYDKK